MISIFAERLEDLAWDMVRFFGGKAAAFSRLPSSRSERFPRQTTDSLEPLRNLVSLNFKYYMQCGDPGRINCTDDNLSRERSVQLTFSSAFSIRKNLQR